ncbi:MAG: helix-turn-helix transcriptional regulator [Reyranella sp.]|nr:helix-turn-helix transcriptional regulator [Reyranella sp.]
MAKAKKPKDYPENPKTLGEHLRKRRRELGLLQREVAGQMGIAVETLINWEKDRTRPVAAQFRPVIDFLGYDPSPEPKILAERVEAKRRVLGVTFEQVANYLGWDTGSLSRYLNGTWRLSSDRQGTLEAFLSSGNQAVVTLLPPRRRR